MTELEKELEAVLGKIHATIEHDQRSLKDIAKESGVNYFWLVRFMGKKLPNPTIRCLRKLAKVLK